jgi:hypothetical protein
MSDLKYRSLKLIEKKRKNFYLKIWTLFFLISFLATIFVYLTHYDNFEIVDFHIDQVNFAPKESFEKIIKEELSKNFLYIIGRNNILFLPTSEIEQKIKSNFSEIKFLELKRVGFRSIALKITEYEKTALWCNQECYFLNEDGMAFAKAESYQKLPVFQGLERDSYLNQNYLEKEYFKNIMTLISLLQEMTIEIKNIKSDDGDSFVLATEIGLNLLYDKKGDPVEVANNLNALIKKDAINFAQLKNIEYIDLRFGNKVYYKIR